MSLESMPHTSAILAEMRREERRGGKRKLSSVDATIGTPERVRHKRRRTGGSTPTDDVYKAAANAAYDTGPDPPGYTRVFSSDTLKVWKDPKDKDLLVGVRGTWDLGDMKANLGLAFNNLQNTKRYKKDEADLLAIARKYPSSKFHFASHSLGAAIARRLEEKVPTLSSKAFNAAFEPSRALDPGKQQRVYKGSDFLGKIGRFLPGSTYKPVTSAPAKKVKWYNPTTWKMFQDHAMSGFGYVGGVRAKRSRSEYQALITGFTEYAELQEALDLAKANGVQQEIDEAKEDLEEFQDNHPEANWRRSWTDTVQMAANNPDEPMAFRFYVPRDVEETEGEDDPDGTNTEEIIESRPGDDIRETPGHREPIQPVELLEGEGKRRKRRRRRRKHGGAARTYANQAKKPVSQSQYNRMSAKQKFKFKTNKLAVNQWEDRNISESITINKREEEAKRIASLLQPYKDNFEFWDLEKELRPVPTFEEYIKQPNRWNDAATRIALPYNNFNAKWQQLFPPPNPDRDADKPIIQQYYGNERVYNAYLDYVSKWKSTKGREWDSGIPLIEEYYEDQAKWQDALRSGLNKGLTMVFDMLQDVPGLGLLSGVASDLLKGKGLMMAARNLAINAAANALNTIAPGAGTAARTAVDLGLQLTGNQGLGKPLTGGEGEEEDRPMTRRERKKYRRIERIMKGTREQLIDDDPSAPWNPVDRYKEAPPLVLKRVSRVNEKVPDPYKTSVARVETTVTPAAEAAAMDDNRNYSVVNLNI